MLALYTSLLRFHSLCLVIVFLYIVCIGWVDAMRHRGTVLGLWLNFFHFCVFRSISR